MTLAWPGRGHFDQRGSARRNLRLCHHFRLGRLQFFPCSPGFILQQQSTIGRGRTGVRPSPRFITRVCPCPNPPGSSSLPCSGQTRGDAAASGLIYNHHRTEVPSPAPAQADRWQLCFLPCTHVGVLLFRECNYMLIQPGQHGCLSGLSRTAGLSVEILETTCSTTSQTLACTLSHTVFFFFT